MWYEIHKQMNIRRSCDNIVIFPTYREITNDGNYDLSPSVIEAVWNKYQYEKFINISDCNVKYFSDTSYFTKVTATIPYLNIQWLSINMLIIILLFMLTWVFPIDFNVSMVTTVVSMVVGVLSLLYLIIYNRLSKKFFGTDDIFYNEPINGNLIMVLSQERS